MEYVEELNNKYVIIQRTSHNKYSFCEKLLHQTSIPGLLDISFRSFNSSEYYYYDVSSKISLKDYYSEKEISFLELIDILSGIVKINKTLTEYLISEDSINLSPDYIFLNPNKKLFYYFLLFDNSIPINNNYSNLAEFLIDRVSPNDEAATKLAYTYYENVSMGIYNPSDILPDSNIINSAVEPEIESVIQMDNNVAEQYYFVDTSDDLDSSKTNKAFFPLVIGSIIILISGVAYTYLFLNINLLNYLGIAQENYIIIGAGLACFLSILLFFTIKIYLKKEEKLELQEKLQEEQRHSEIMNPGRMEKIEYEMKKQNSDDMPVF